MRYIAIGAALTLLAGLATLPGGRSASAADNDQKWGTVKGQITVAGNAPKPEMIDVNKDKDHCLSKGPLFKEEWVVNPKNKGVRWVLVWLTPEKGANAKLPIHPDLEKFKPEVSMDQPCCQFVPHCLGMRSGQKLVMHNSAEVSHNVHWTGNPRMTSGGNVVIPKKKSYTINNISHSDKAFLPIVNIQCDFHTWMRGRVGVFDHPYFAVTDKDGNFEIKNAPAGKWRLKILHDSGWLGGRNGRDGQPVTVKGGKVTTVKNLKLTP